MQAGVWKRRNWLPMRRLKSTSFVLAIPAVIPHVEVRHPRKPTALQKP